jgi:TadE-like protein
MGGRAGSVHRTQVRMRNRRRMRGQAAVEAALTLPLVVFMFLGTLQLFLMFNGRILAQLAAFKATRTGSVSHGSCQRMLDAAILQVLPAIDSYMTPAPGTPGQKLAAAFSIRRFNRYSGTLKDKIEKGGSAVNASGTIIWLIRDFAPRRPDLGAKMDSEFDQSLAPMRMETRLIFWFPMRIPFANWVISKIVLSSWQLETYTYQNPLLFTNKANWAGTGAGRPAAAIAAEMQARHAIGEFVFPISATYSMRMMTPLKSQNAVPKNCAPTPPGL